MELSHEYGCKFWMDGHTEAQSLPKSNNFLLKNSILILALYLVLTWLGLPCHFSNHPVPMPLLPCPRQGRKQWFWLFSLLCAAEGSESTICFQCGQARELNIDPWLLILKSCVWYRKSELPQGERTLTCVFKIC